jgi:hypothetical protein
MRFKTPRTFSLFAVIVLVSLSCFVFAAARAEKRRSLAVQQLKSLGFQVFFLGEEIPQADLVSPNRHKGDLYAIQYKYRPNGKPGPIAGVLDSLMGKYAGSDFDSVVIRQHYTLLDLSTEDIFALDASPPEPSFQDRLLTTDDLVGLSDMPNLINLSVTTDFDFEDASSAIALCDSLKVLHLDAPQCKSSHMARILKQKNLTTAVLVSVQFDDSDSDRSIFERLSNTTTFLVKCKLRPELWKSLEDNPSIKLINCRKSKS